MKASQRAEHKARLLAQIAQQREQLSQAAEGWLDATQGLDRGWQLLVRYRHLALTGGVVLLGWGLLSRERLTRLYRRARRTSLYRHSPLLLSLGGWLLGRR